MTIRLACLAAALACTAAFAAPPPLINPVLTRDDVKAHKVRIEEGYDHAQTRCRRVQGHARELCNEQARGDRDVQQAELDFQALPTPENDRKLRLQKAEAAYSISLIRCKDMDGQAKEVCRRDAKMVYNDAKVEAKLQNDVATPTLRAENTVRERTVVAEKMAEAQYISARERCEMLPGEGREPCIADVKKRFGKL
ncbi:MAG: hypothetical protein JWP22_1933 [Ramlibacter sp.]|jgi:hypothetical protein|nr:hypothetical protein [Ramlibacter sp.]MDB5913258.1 hypothetical protein [Ramlibacter sp.]